jgi:hypothetical protein
MTELSNAIAKATRAAYEQLIREHEGDYYYFVLATTWDGTVPAVSAWSREALSTAVQSCEDRVEAEWGLKWSYADSPFFCFGDQYFDEVRRLIELRPDMRKLRGEARNRELSLRVDAMVEAMKFLESEGLFGTGERRNRIFINVEINPPDSTNTARAEFLNPMDARKEWIEEMAEPTE